MCVFSMMTLMRGYMLDNENEIDDSSNDNGSAKQNDRLAQQKRNRLKAIVYANRI